jgi:transposase
VIEAPGGQPIVWWSIWEVVMDVIVERPAALDVHNASVMACVRTPGADGKRVSEVHEFKTTVGGLLVLADWLGAHGVTDVAMEATGTYWKPVWAVLEDDFRCMLVNARAVKQVPGRKTDVKDAEWLCQLLEAGLLKACLVPPPPIRTLRNLTRYRKSQIRDRQREANRLHKVMQDTGIKLDTVASDLLGKSGRDMLDALVAGTTDPIVLADLARGQLRKKIPALQEALQGRFGSEHRLVVGRILAHIDFLDESIAGLSEEIEAQLGPFGNRQVELLCTIPGVQRRAAEVIIAETGGDMSAFPTAKHLCSWAGICPGNDQSAGKRRSGKTTKGSKWLRGTLIESAKAAGRTKDTYLYAQYARLKARRGVNKASVAVAHSILTAVWHMLCTGEIYVDLGGDYYARRNPERQTKRLIAQLEKLGHIVTLQPTTTTTTTPTGVAA